MSKTTDTLTYHEKPLTLISENPGDGKFSINLDTLDFIKTVPEPLAVISVAGLYRTGKSYLLNKMLLNTKQGFEVAPSVNACTKGLWVWSKPIKGKTPEGEEINILVIDSEGLGALDRDTNWDTRVFSLAILVSSLFIYNSVGNIDEHALESLALVVNLTKQIQIRANSEDVDFEDYARHFPSFVWILRDFSLQLLGIDGEQITSKEYLERALKTQKGFSDGIEQKNRIRKHISELFRDRDCFTFVRPVTKESELQNLNNMELTDLRPEFVDQVMQLRKKVIERIAPKKLNGTPINGEILSELIKNYVEAINDGAIPNIENAWTRICRNECSKRAAEALKFYENRLNDDICKRLPLSEPEIKNLHNKFKAEAVTYYRQKALGEVAGEYEKELTAQIKGRLTAALRNNAEEAKKMCESLLLKEYTSIDKKLKNHEYENFDEFEADVNLFYTYFMEKGPNIPAKETILLDYLNESIKFAAGIFIKMNENELETQKKLSGDMRAQLDHQISELKTEFMKERNSLQAKVTQLQTEKSQLELREATYMNNLSELKTDLSKTEYAMRSEFDKEKALSKQMIEDLKQKLAAREQQCREQENKMFLMRSEFEKEKALLVQNVQLLERQFEDVASKEREQKQILNQSRVELSSQLKETTSQYENNLRSLQKKISSLNERIQEQDDIIKQKESQIEELHSISLQEMTNKDTLISGYIDKIKTLEISLADFRSGREDEVQRMRFDYEDTIKTLKVQLDCTENSNRDKDEKLKTLKSKNEKEKALLQQKMDFLEVQLRDTKSLLDDSKKNHDRLLETFEKTSQENKVDIGQLNEMKESYEVQIKKLQDEVDVMKRKHSYEMEQMMTKSTESDLKFQFQLSEVHTQNVKLKSDLDAVRESREELQNQIKVLESQKKKLLDEVEYRYAGRIRELERQLEEKVRLQEVEFSEVQSKSEEHLNQLRGIFEVEKQRYEKRIQEEKERIERQVAQQVEELEQKLEEERQAHDEEVEALNNQMRESEVQYQQELQQLEHEVTLKQQAIDSLEKYLRDTKENLNSIHTSHSSTMEQQLESFNRERKSFLEKIEELNHLLSRNEKELFTFRQKSEQLEATLMIKENTINTLRKDISEERIEMANKLEAEKREHQKITDEYLGVKVELAKETALTSQQNEFLKRRIDELKKQNEELAVKFEDTIRSQKENYNKEINELLEKSNMEKTAYEEKYDQKRKSTKELEATYQKKISQLEKDKVILCAQLSTLESKKSEYEKRFAVDHESFSNQLNELRESFSNERKALQGEIERYKDKLHQIEHESAEVQSNYERDRALWEGKYNFLEQQRDQAKQDLNEAQKKFELTLQQLQKVRNYDKEANESNQNALITSIEKRYQNKISEIQEAHYAEIRELNDRRLKLEKELKSLNDRNLLENYSKNPTLTEKRIADLVEGERKLLKEIEDLKAERDAKAIEYQKKLDYETETMRAKIKELEGKYKDSENKRSLLIFEHEKERAKWLVEKDYINSQANELQDVVKKIEKKKENLLRENERLRSDSKSSRKSLNTSVCGPQTKPANGYVSRREVSQSPIGKKLRINLEGDENMHFSLKTFELFRQAAANNEAIRAGSTRSDFSLSNHDESTHKGEDEFGNVLNNSVTMNK